MKRNRKRIVFYYYSLYYSCVCFECKPIRINEVFLYGKHNYWFNFYTSTFGKESHILPNIFNYEKYESSLNVRDLI